MASLICNACAAPIGSDAERSTHYKSEWHRYNVKRRCAGLTSIPQALFEQQLAALQNKKAAESAQKNAQQCRLCKKSFATQAAFQAHLQTKKHQKKSEKAAAGGADDDEEEEEEDAEMGADKQAATTPSAAASTAATPASAKPAKAGAKAESKHDDEDDEEDEDGEDEEEEEEGEAIPLLHCLFCSKKDFPTVAASVEHMLKQHGFFIPFVENLVDLEGLLSYLGEKVGLGHICLWCNGKGRARYPSTHAVQQHMKAKSHCKLRLEEEEDEEELMDFYDFDLEEEDEDEEEEDEEEEVEAGKGAAAAGSGSGKEDKNAGALVVVSSPKDAAPPRRAGGGGASSINSAGELVLADGSIVGARQHARIYKQHVRPTRAPELDAITANYKRLALTTDVRENPRIYRRKKEAFHQRARKREDLAKGLNANFQHHFRAQVSY